MPLKTWKRITLDVIDGLELNWKSGMGKNRRVIQEYELPGKQNLSRQKEVNQ